MRDTLSPMSWLIFCLAITKAFLVFSSFSVICCLSVSSWEALSCSSCLSLVSSVCSLEDCSRALRPSVSRSVTTCRRPGRHDKNKYMHVQNISIFAGTLSRFLRIFIAVSCKLWSCKLMKYGLPPWQKAKKLNLLNWKVDSSIKGFGLNLWCLTLFMFSNCASSSLVLASAWVRESLRLCSSWTEAWRASSSWDGPAAASATIWRKHRM